MGIIVDLFAGGGGASQGIHKATGKTEQVRLIGNAVCPDVAAALVAANYVESRVEEICSPAGVAASM